MAADRKRDGSIWGKGNLLAAYGGDEFDAAEGEVGGVLVENRYAESVAVSGS